MTVGVTGNAMRLSWVRAVDPTDDWPVGDPLPAFRRAYPVEPTPRTARHAQN